MADFEEIRELISRKLSAMGMELYDIKHIKAGRHSSLRIYMDKPEGVTIADCERASNELSILLDVENFSNHEYTLEISSPGIDRPLKTDRDFKRAKGRDVAVNLREPVLDKKFLSGTVVDYENDTVIMSCKGQTVSIPLSKIEFGKIEFNFK